MRLFLAILSIAVPWSITAAAAEPPDARAAYVERRGLVEADAHCGLFSPEMTAALQAGATQARGALLRSGWSTTQVGELESAVVAAAHARACNDQRTLSAAADARTGFANWINAASMDFAGGDRGWTARRLAAADGWRLRQTIAGPIAASFGVRDHDGRQELVLLIPVARRSAPPSSAQLVMRDPSRGDAGEISLARRISFGLEAGLPAPGVSQYIPSARRMERVSGEDAQAVFVFPNTAFADLLALDPRESVEIRVRSNAGETRLLVEVGDIAVARAFLTIRPR